MPDYLASIPDAYTNVSPGFLETLFQSRRAELFTGLMRVHYRAGEVFVFTFLDGVQHKLYRCLEKSTEVIPHGSWSVATDLADASVSFIPMTVESMRVMQVAYETPICNVDEQLFTPQQLTDQMAVWSRGGEAVILHIRSEKFHHVYLMSGTSNPVLESVSFTDTSSDFSLNDSSFASLLPPVEYRVTRYVSDHEHELWQGYDLRLAFNPLMRLLLNRFSELAGRMLTERLCEQLCAWLREEGWNIKVSMNGVANRHYFETLESGIHIYLGILRCFHEEASPAIGLRMAEGLSRDILLKLDPYRRDTLKRHIYNENRLDTVTGKIWR